MNLYKDFFMVIVPGILAGLLARSLHESSLLVLQVDWGGELARVIHALTEPGVMATIVASLGALARYEIWKRRLRRKHEDEIADLQAEIARLKGREDDAA